MFPRGGTDDLETERTNECAVGAKRQEIAGWLHWEYKKNEE